MVQVVCQCGRALNFPESHFNKPAKCPACKEILRAVSTGGTWNAPAQVGKLIISKGPERVGEQIFLGGQSVVAVGKLPDRTLILRGATVSRKHCRLVRNGAGWRIEDEGSTHGLLVNGQKLSSHDLRDGDVLAIGEYELRYICLRPAAVAVKPGTATELRPKPAPPTTAEPDGTYSLAEADSLYALADDDRSVISGPTPAPAPARTSTYLQSPVASGEAGDRVHCPSCNAAYRGSAKICVGCGIDLRTGRAIITSEESHLDQVYVAAEQVIAVLSWIFWVGIYPIASEAFGTRKPYTIRAVAVITILASAWFWAYEWTDSPKMQSLKNLMLWSGNPDPVATLLSEGDSDEDTALTMEDFQFLRQHYFGTFHTYQLITHAFLHADIMHLAGNLLFLLVFGSRVNALLGNWWTLALYPVLAALAGVVHMQSVAHDFPSASLGASGAIMGLAGMYLIMFPVHKVHLAYWWRWGLIRGFELSLHLFAVRGFWVVLAYIGLDALYVSISWQDNVAHWAHLGGFGAGVVLAMALLLARLVNCRGGDIISTILGRRAWALIGRPRRG